MTDNITNRLEASPEKKEAFRDQMQERLLGRINGELQLPSVEQMRYEVETGDVSPKSAATAQAILRAAEDPVMLAHVGGVLTELEPKFDPAAAYHEEQARLYKEKLDMGLLVGSGVKPDVKKIASHFVKKMNVVTEAIKDVGEVAQRTTTAFREVGEKVGRVKKEYVPQPHLTHRPFKTSELQALRDQLRRGA